MLTQAFIIAAVADIQAHAASLPAPTPTPPAPRPAPSQKSLLGLLPIGIDPEIAITDGKLSAGLSIDYQFTDPFGGSDSATGLLSLGGDINTSNLIEGGVVEADTEYFTAPFFTIHDGGLNSDSVDVSGTANLGTLAVSGLLGQIDGGFLGQSYTLIGGFPTISLDDQGHASLLLTGEVVYGTSLGASGAVGGSIAPTGAALSASGGAQLGPLDGNASAGAGLYYTGISAGITTVGA